MAFNLPGVSGNRPKSRHSFKIHITPSTFDPSIKKKKVRRSFHIIFTLTE